MKHPKPSLKNKASPSFDEIIKYDHYARKLQSKCFFSSFAYLKNKFLSIFSNETN